jgi:acetate kinase
VKPWVLVINAGSSSLKYQVFDSSTFEIRAKGVVERIGEIGFVSNHDEALELVVTQLLES